MTDSFCTRRNMMFTQRQNSVTTLKSILRTQAGAIMLLIDTKSHIYAEKTGDETPRGTAALAFECCSFLVELFTNMALTATTA